MEKKNTKSKQTLYYITLMSWAGWNGLNINDNYTDKFAEL